ncbi:hypothetical protein RDI58_013117 [Solanum bulbocastanum]|uniref:BED-type domain-containing protein n=1 Tax=Solanum bulbocastanum TaxID=147425 RepID=A0AAN8TIY8_SOLBU
MPRLHGSNARSPVWNHYVKLEEKKDGSWTVKCVHCGRVTYYHSHKIGTASLRKHVKLFGVVELLCCVESWVTTIGKGLKGVIVVLTVENLVTTFNSTRTCFLVLVVLVGSIKEQWKMKLNLLSKEET